ncbi:G-type lectin S-receptor-like serine/threonine-protein kinase [Melia azedarach]|uniref:G-type lectin S-receptor-like serine/threonine-protein kinase n=1 Tax=Melia azedarach TaxID=155640 RepID=A0ACC1YF26_MELAZ|nr:G-type lectin S-receptor-like serine/threonine-protein kinase [Melia azedarach]
MVSSSGDFAFGFYRLVIGLFLGGIWFDKISERTLVWSANRDDPAQVGSSINLKCNGQLALTHSNGTEFLIYNGTSTSSALIQNHGNLLLLDLSPKIIWQSFNFPGDTILLGQDLVMGQNLYSNTNGTVNYSMGRYILEVQMDGNFVLSAFRYADPGYWHTSTQGDQNVRLIFNQSTVFMYVVDKTTIKYPMTTQVSTPIEDYFHRATVSDHGNPQQWAYRKRNGNQWTVVWEVITEPCTFNNICGVFGFCSSLDNKQVTCSCLPGYSPIDPNSPSKGCYPNVAVDFCVAEFSDFTVEAIDNANIPNDNSADMARITKIDVNECSQSVMDDCFCAAGVWKESACHKKRMPLLNARRSNPSTNNMVAFIKVPKINNQIRDKDKKSSLSWVVLLAGLLSCSMLALVFGSIVIYYHPLTWPYISVRTSPKPKLKPLEINLKRFHTRSCVKQQMGSRVNLAKEHLVLSTVGF